MTDDSLLPFNLPTVCRKKVTAAFDGGLISSDGGLVLLREEERRLGLADLLANCLRDRRDPALVTHMGRVRLRTSRNRRSMALVVRAALRQVGSLKAKQASSSSRSFLRQATAFG